MVRSLVTIEVCTHTRFVFNVPRLVVTPIFPTPPAQPCSPLDANRIR